MRVVSLVVVTEQQRLCEKLHSQNRSHSFYIVWLGKPLLNYTLIYLRIHYLTALFSLVGPKAEQQRHRKCDASILHVLTVCHGDVSADTKNVSRGRIRWHTLLCRVCQIKRPYDTLYRFGVVMIICWFPGNFPIVFPCDASLMNERNDSCCCHWIHPQNNIPNYHPL